MRRQQTQSKATRSRRSWRDDSGQTIGFLVKIVLGVALLGFLAVELGAPIVTKMTLDNDLQNVLLDARAALTASENNVDLAYERISPELADNGVVVTEFSVTPSSPENPRGVLRITLEKEARSLVVTRVIKSMKSYYTVEVSGETPLR
ncbi:MAG: hypothetical protein IT198_14045 [Acidimicrobiia bacterium]|nr:hypothetical protein [Acidimicrobiia bacterium]